MIEGSTIIFNEEYIAELTRHKDIAQSDLDKEINPKLREELQKKVDYFTKKLELAMDFQDTVEEIINIDVPCITTIKTISGIVIPAKNVQVL